MVLDMMKAINVAIIKLACNSWDFTDEHAEKILGYHTFSIVYVNQKGTITTGYKEIIKGVQTIEAFSLAANMDY